MRRLLIILSITITTTLLFGQPETPVIKLQAIGGGILRLSQTITSINPNPTLGGELAVEFPSWDAYPWQQ